MSSPFGAGLRSVLVPGWGQLSGSRRRLGWVLIFATTAAVAGLMATVVTAVTLVGSVGAVARLADPELLQTLLAANVVVAITRLVSVEHAWWTRGGRNVFVAVLLGVIVLLPHVVVGWFGVEVRHTLVEVFAPPPPPTAPTLPETTSTTVPTTVPTTTTPPTSTTVPTTTTTTVTTTTTAPTTTTTLPMGRERLTVLLLGGDAGPGRTGLRTDTTMVASVDTTTGAAAIFGLPRNFGSLRFSDGTRFTGTILNSVYGWGRRNPEVFGGVDPGASAVMDVAEHLTGLDIDYFLLVDLTGFADLVDVVGGITLTVPAPVDGPLYDPETGDYTMVRIDAGPQTLDGGRALAYARSRLGTTDYARMARQRCLISALVDEMDPLDLITRLPDFLTEVESHVTTDLPVDLVPDLITLADRVEAGSIRAVGFGPSWGLGRNQRGYVVPDVERIRAAVQEVLAEPASDLVPRVAAACG